MKKLITIIFLLASTTCFATNYYVANSGNDANAGTSTATAWATISKVNSSSFSAGDTIFFNRGDVWYETLTVPSSGALGNPIVFTSYGTGKRPVIDGGELITSWTNLGSNIYSANLSVAGSTNGKAITFNSVLHGKGRFPKDTAVNKGCWYATSTSFSSPNVTIIDANLKTLPNLVGSEIVMRRMRWVLTVFPVVAHTDSALSFTELEQGTYRGYFLQNKLSFCTMNREWFHDKDSSKLKVYFSSTPTDTVRVSARKFCVVLNSKNYNLFKDLQFSTADSFAVTVKGTGNKFYDCTVSGSNNGVLVYYQSSRTSIVKCNINNINSVGIWNPGISTLIDSCSIKDIAAIPGIAGGGTYSRTGIMCYQYDATPPASSSDSVTISNCTIDNIGYNAIRFDGESSKAFNNTISRYCQLTDDGGAIYTWNNYLSKPYTNRQVYNNYIDGTTTMGSGVGTFSYETTPEAFGIYCDDAANYVDVKKNTVINTTGGGVYLHNANHINVDSNTIYNTPEAVWVRLDALNPTARIYTSYLNVRNNNFINTQSQYALFIEDYNTIGYDSIRYMGVVDSNRYIVPMGNKYRNANFIYISAAPNVQSRKDHSVHNLYTDYGWEQHGSNGAVNTKGYEILTSGTSIPANHRFVTGVDTLTNAAAFIDWDGASPLDTGAAKLRYTSGVEYSQFSIGSTAQGLYLVTMSNIATQDAYANFCITQTGRIIPDAQYDTTYYTDIYTTRKEDTFLVAAFFSSGKFLIKIKGDVTKYPAWVDNLYITPVTANRFRMTDSIYVLYNPLATADSVTLPVSGVDVATGDQFAAGNVYMEGKQSRFIYSTDELPVHPVNPNSRRLIFNKANIPGYTKPWLIKRSYY